jgi:hypothetical protein
MKLQTARELLRETERAERTTAVPSRLTCRSELDPRTGQLSCVWMLQPDEQ